MLGRHESASGGFNVGDRQMGALARFAEWFLVILREGKTSGGGLKRAATILAALLVVATAVAVSYMRMAYQWSR